MDNTTNPNFTTYGGAVALRCLNPYSHLLEWWQTCRCDACGHHPRSVVVEMDEMI